MGILRTITALAFSLTSVFLPSAWAEKTRPVRGDSNIAIMFNRDGEERRLLDWTELTTLTEAILLRESFVRNRDFIGARREYRLPAGDQIEITILVPHPSQRMAVQYDLIPQFAGYKPPALQAESSKEMTINGAVGTFYVHENGACSIFFKMPQDAVVNLFDKGCRKQSNILDKAKQVNLERLAKKLSS